MLSVPPRSFGALPRHAVGALALAVWLTAGRALGQEATIEVRGELAPTGRRDDVAASTAVVGERLREPGASSADVLAAVPGVQVSRTGSSSDLATASIRGATSAQTPVYLAGVRLNDDLTGTADLSTVPLSLVRRVEVYRGSSPLELDRASMGGAVSFEPLFDARSRVGAGFALGSFGEQSAFARTGVSGKRARASLLVARESADNDWTFRDARGAQQRRVNADFSAYSLWSISRYDPSPRIRVLGVLHGYYREQGTPGTAALPDDRARTTSDRLLGAVNVRVDCAATVGTDDCALQLVTSALRTTTSLSDPLREVIPAASAWSSGERLEQSARLEKRLARAVSVIPSATIARERIDAGYTGQSRVTASRLLLRPGLAGELRAGERLTFVAAVAVERDTATGDSTERRAAVLSPVLRLGVKATLTDFLQLRANVGHYSRTPTLGELYGVSANVHGNAALRAERGPSVDLGFRLQGGERSWRLQADAFGFAREASELIAYRQTSPTAISPYNVGEARLLGLESALAVELLGCVLMSATGTLLDPRNVTSGRAERNRILPFRSRLVAMAEGELFTREPWPKLPFERLAAGARVLHRASKYADAAGLLVVPHQTVLDLHASALLRGQVLALRAAVRNVLNAAELDAIGVPLSGRSFHLSVEGRLQ
ncbi:MAG: TonB-dependent receptor [Myxococcales bacterium]|nr:MAG: TonB-dependent receptor [Myxococcales bacterium]